MGGAHRRLAREAEELESSIWLVDVAIEVEASEDGLKVRVLEAGLELRGAGKD